ncbi:MULTISPECIES: hypothetical protein [Paraburkholderia]|uniref:hypothetical protein n=1 Tax=Paraburkholderia TaxID=1822464 RepID=UPI0028A9C88A|nr:hypothetical protein [Paraburkholderia podalyriae]
MIDPSLHLFVTGNYRIETPAIQAFYELVTQCLHYRIMGALIYGLSRIGKLRASDTSNIAGTQSSQDDELPCAMRT